MAGSIPGSIRNMPKLPSSRASKRVVSASKSPEEQSHCTKSGNDDCEPDDNCLGKLHLKLPRRNLLRVRVASASTRMQAT